MMNFQVTWLDLIPAGYFPTRDALRRRVSREGTLRGKITLLLICNPRKVVSYNLVRISV